MRLSFGELFSKLRFQIVAYWELLREYWDGWFRCRPENDLAPVYIFVRE